MKSCIIIPPSSFLDDDKVFVQLGPYYIKRFVEENSNHTVDILSTPPFSNLGSYDVVGFSVTTPQYDYVDSILSELPSCTTVLGGPHTDMYQIEHGKFTYVVRKDGCRPFLNILNGKDPGNGIDDLDQLPHRDKSFYDYKYFINGTHATHAITSRGCPMGCRFCESARTTVRYKSADTVRRELEECVNLGFKAVMFFDDLFCASVKRVKELCEVIKPFGIKFRCFAHAHNFSEEMAKVLKESGCVEIGFGAEHASQKILDLVDKRTKAEQNYELVKIANSFGIGVKAFLMIGLPGEDHETVRELERFILTSGVSGGINDFDLCIYYPFVGTEIAANPEKYGIIIERENSSAYFKGKLGSSSCAVRTKALSKEEIIEYQKKLYSYNKRWRKESKNT